MNEGRGPVRAPKSLALYLEHSKKLQHMKTLIIHPDDRSTDFLRPIYQNIKGATVLTKNISGKQLEKEIQSHDQILMMGHGSPSGLFSMSKIGEGTFIVGEKQVPLLRDKHCIFIWCNADQFVSRHRLKGLYTGMFISEVGEANYCKVPADQETVDVSNSRFADLLGDVLTEGKADYSKVFEHVKTFYGKLATINEIADYNNQRWYFEPRVRASETFNLYLTSNKNDKNMFKKFDQFIDRAMDKKWVRITLFTVLIVHTILACIGWIVLAVVFG